MAFGASRRMALVAVLLVVVLVVMGGSLTSTQCVGMEGLDPGWQLESPGLVRKTTRGLEACRRLCVHWTPCRACSFQPDQQLCLLSASPPRQTLLPQPSSEGGFVSQIVNTTDCRDRHPCKSRPCGPLETCAAVNGGTSHVCLQALCPGRNLVYLEGAAVCVHAGSHTWKEGRELCTKTNGTMVTATSPSRLENITNTMREVMAVHNSSGIYVWFGMKKDSGKWMWENGQEVNGLIWSGGQPDGSGDCAYFHLTASTMYIDDGPCDEPKMVLCEFPLNIQ